MKTLIKNVYVVMPDGTTPVTNIMLDGQNIAAIGDVPDTFRPGKVIDGKNHLAVPGFVNAHTHTSMTLLRSYADDMALMDWLNDMVWPAEAKMNEEDIYWGAMLALVEMIRSGTTTFADMYGPYMNRVAEATLDTGIRGVLSRGIIGVAPDGDKKLQENVDLYKEFHGSGDGRLTVMFGPHAPYTCPPEFLQQVAKTAQSLGAGIHIHMHETRTEVEDSLKQYGKRPFAWVAETRLFDCDHVLAAHCVHLDDNDIAIMKKYKINAAHNPGSNMKLASGVCPVPRLLKEGIVMALGTDGASSNNNLDMLEEVNLAAMLHKVNEYDPLAVPAFPRAAPDFPGRPGFPQALPAPVPAFQDSPQGFPAVPAFRGFRQEFPGVPELPGFPRALPAAPPAFQDSPRAAPAVPGFPDFPPGAPGSFPQAPPRTPAAPQEPPPLLRMPRCRPSRPAPRLYMQKQFVSTFQSIPPMKYPSLSARILSYFIQSTYECQTSRPFCRLWGLFCRIRTMFGQIRHVDNLTIVTKDCMILLFGCAEARALCR